MTAKKKQDDRVDFDEFADYVAKDLFDQLLRFGVESARKQVRFHIANTRRLERNKEFKGD